MSEASFEDLTRRMEGAIDALKKEFRGLRTGRASPNLLESVMVDAYGSKTPIGQVGTVTVPESRMLVVQVWDAGLTKSVEKAIAEAGLGLNPQPDGQLIRIPIPDLTEERRLELVKVAGKYTEQARIAVRNIRRDGMDLFKKQEKDGDISKDQCADASDRVQKITDEHIKKIDALLVQKESDITTV